MKMTLDINMDDVYVNDDESLTNYIKNLIAEEVKKKLKKELFSDKRFSSFILDKKNQILTKMCEDK
jgi:hypothetical protein